MMGTAVQRHLGTTTQAAVGAGVAAADVGLTVALGPVGALAGSVLGLVTGVLSGVIAGCGNTCIHDTEITEAAQLGYNALWYELTGEDLGGVTGVSGGCTCTPGQCGKEHCAIFDPQGTQYPNVPSGPLGYTDASAIIAQGQSIYQNGRGQMERSASLVDYDNNWNGFLTKCNIVLAAQQKAAAGSSSASGTATAGTFLGISSTWLYLLGALGVIWAVS